MPAQKPVKTMTSQKRIAPGSRKVAGTLSRAAGSTAPEAADFDPVSTARLRMKAQPRGARASKRLTRGGMIAKAATGRRRRSNRDFAYSHAMSRLDPTIFIRANLPVAAVPGVPEIKLHKASPTSGLWRLAQEDEDGFGAPYWAHYWAGGLALARYVLDNPVVVAGLRVLDLGAGSGLVGIAAAKAGARAVIAAEVDPYAIAALKLNMKLNGASISVVREDLTAGDPPAETDVILVGDLFYAADLSERVTAFLDRCSNSRNSGAHWRSLARPPANLAAHGIGAVCRDRRGKPWHWAERRVCIHSSPKRKRKNGLGRRRGPRLRPLAPSFKRDLMNRFDSGTGGAS